MNMENRMLRDQDSKPSKKTKTKAKPEGPPGIQCPKCGKPDAHYVYSTRPIPGGRRRYRACRACGKYFTTDEVARKP